MRTFISVIFIFAITLSACVSPTQPQVTVITSEVTVTLTPPPATETPTPTSTKTVETVTAIFDLGVVLAPGEVNEDGSRNIETFAAPEEFADNEAAVARWLKYFNAERLGFDADATEWILTEDGEAKLVAAGNHNIQIARWGEIPWLGEGKAGVIWNWENFVEGDGENVLFDVCEKLELTRKWGLAEDKDRLSDFDQLLMGREEAIIRSGADMMYGDGEKIMVSSVGGAIFSQDGKSIVATRHMKSPEVSGEGFLLTRDIHGNSVILFTENNDWTSFSNMPK